MQNILTIRNLQIENHQQLSLWKSDTSRRIRSSTSNLNPHYNDFKENIKFDKTLLLAQLEVPVV